MNLNALKASLRARCQIRVSCVSAVSLSLLILEQASLDLNGLQDRFHTKEPCDYRLTNRLLTTGWYDSAHMDE